MGLTPTQEARKTTFPGGKAFHSLSELPVDVGPAHLRGDMLQVL